MRTLELEILSTGALVDVVIGITDARRRALMKAQAHVPAPVEATLLVDTGASCTMVDDALMRTLQLNPTGATRFHSASSAASGDDCDLYDVQLFIGGMATPNTLKLGPLPIMARGFINQPFSGLLGRDVLNRVHMAWRGPAGKLVLSYP